MVRRVAFISGLLLGSGITAFALGTILIYILTGKVIAFQSSEEHGLRVVLCDLHTFREAPLNEEEAA